MNQYFDSPTGAEKRRTVSATAWGHDLVFTTASGVFSHDGLDHATAVLLREVAPPTSGTVLDLGSGWGPIACLLAAAAPDADVWAVDVNERAVALTAENAAANDVHVQAALPDDVPAGISFDQIWSNPPIRIGKAELHALLLRWLPRLTPEGEAFLVVGRNLGADSLQAWLSDQGWPTTRLASAKGFRVLRVRRV